jgi:hypothetical protein
MLTGWAAGKPCQSAQGGGIKAFVLAVLVAAAVAWMASGALLPPPPPAPPPAATPAW